MPIHHYTRQIEIKSTKRVADAAGFKHDLEAKLPNPQLVGLYVIFHETTPVYVGCSKGIGKTLTTGHTRDYPYKWLTSYAGKTLTGHFFSFDEEFTGLPIEGVREAIEGEVVYEIRRITGKWPVGQNEIHFWEMHRGHAAIMKCATTAIETLRQAGALPKTSP